MKRYIVLGVLQKLEWCKTHSNCTRWGPCPTCGRIKPGQGGDEFGNYPLYSGHSDECLLNALITTLKQSESVEII